MKKTISTTYLPALFGLALISSVLFNIYNYTSKDKTEKGGIFSSYTTSTNILSDLNMAIVKTAGESQKSVVTITTTKKIKLYPSNDNFFLNLPFSFFDRRSQREDYLQRGLGSGVIVSEDGYILTNNHVIKDVDEIMVELGDGNRIIAELIGKDSETDLAILKIKSEGLTPIKLGDSKNLKVGQIVFAIGSPLNQNLARSISMGIISALERRDLRLNAYEDYIQTDAAINPGNSGGALVNVEGKLIGINTLIASNTGGYQGIGFAIPIDIARKVMESIIENGRVIRGYVGIFYGGEVNNVVAQATGLDKPRGFIVGKVLENGPAGQAGIQEGDIIVQVNNKDIKSWDDFRLMIAANEPGTTLSLVIYRKNKKNKINVTLKEKPREKLYSHSNDDDDKISHGLGFEIEDLDFAPRELIRGLSQNAKGVIVINIEEDSHAWRQGLRKGDLVVEIDWKSVNTLREFKEIIEKVKESKEAIMLKVERQQSTLYIALQL